MNYNYKPNYLNGKALSQHSISSLNNNNNNNNNNKNPACIHLHALNSENNFKTNRSISYNLNSNSNLSLNQQKFLLGTNSYYHNSIMPVQQILNSKSVVTRANSFKKELNLVNNNPIDNFIFAYQQNQHHHHHQLHPPPPQHHHHHQAPQQQQQPSILSNANKFVDLSLQKLNKKILSIDKYIKNNRSESSSTISLLSDLEFEIKDELTVNEVQQQQNKTINDDEKKIEQLPLLSDSKSRSSIFNYRPVIEDSLETLIKAAAKTNEKLDKENYDNHYYSTNKNKPILGETNIEPVLQYSKEKYKLTRNKANIETISSRNNNNTGRFSCDTSNNNNKLYNKSNKSRAHSKSSTSSYYNRVESSSSIDSLNKNSSGSSKNLFKKNLSLYYDSGIGVESPLTNNFYSKYLRLNKMKRLAATNNNNNNNNSSNNSSMDQDYLTNMNKSSHEMNNNQSIRIKNSLIKCNKSDYNLRNNNKEQTTTTPNGLLSSLSSNNKQQQISNFKSYCKTLNPSMGRRFYNELNVFNSLNSSSSASISASDKKIKLKDDCLKSKQQYSTSDIDGKSVNRIALRSSSPNNFKKFFSSSLSMQGKEINEKLKNNPANTTTAAAASTGSSSLNRKNSFTLNDTNYVKADFTPHLLSTNSLNKTSSIKPTKSLQKINKLQTKNDVTIRVNKTFPMFKTHSIVGDDDCSELNLDVAHQNLKSSSNIQQEQKSSTKNLSESFQKQCIETISKNLNNLTNELNGRKFKSNHFVNSSK